MGGRAEQEMETEAPDRRFFIKNSVVFAAAGTISPTVVVAFGVCVSIKVAVFTAISECGISDRWMREQCRLQLSGSNLAQESACYCRGRPLYGQPTCKPLHLISSFFRSTRYTRPS